MNKSTTSLDPSEALAVAERAGIDLSLIDVNLRLSVKERWEQHDGALELVVKLQEAGERTRAHPQPTTRDAR